MSGWFYKLNFTKSPAILLRRRFPAKTQSHKEERGFTRRNEETKGARRGCDWCVATFRWRVPRRVLFLWRVAPFDRCEARRRRRDVFVSSFLCAKPLSSCARGAPSLTPGPSPSRSGRARGEESGLPSCFLLRVFVSSCETSFFFAALRLCGKPSALAQMKTPPDFSGGVGSALTGVGDYDVSGMIWISTRRFLARPAGVAFVATGRLSPRPMTYMRCGITPFWARM